MGLFDRFKQSLAKTRDKLAGGVRAVLSLGRKIDEQVLAELHNTLLAADVGPATTDKLIEVIRAGWRKGEVSDADQIRPFLRDHIVALWPEQERQVLYAPSGPTVILVAGINGSGKTTSVAKMANFLKKEGKSVILGACDTFRAAAVAQLTEWLTRIGVQIVKHQQNADPAAVAYDACEAALARNADVLLIDTAGRLHTQDHLMRELGKIQKVVQKKIPTAPHEVLLVLDATIGQNAVNQARMFREHVAVTGIILAKLDGSAKGGVVIGIRDQLEVPVKFVGLGETPDDIAPFDPATFIAALLAD